MQLCHCVSYSGTTAPHVRDYLPPKTATSTTTTTRAMRPPVLRPNELESEPPLPSLYAPDAEGAEVKPGSVLVACTTDVAANVLEFVANVLGVDTAWTRPRVVVKFGLSTTVTVLVSSA